ncbi:OFA family MFS transporter [Ruminiclostridium cellulolyticum]|uniref:Major facilitator superfamily MFS_1 n=1 Tax=Ruminiclostridium cellulolyticum (strain ATCC 35319 / DSM 5812 / JCM 6584 / H10) TaxID=394503 RepID=B8I5J1_RUMCH|nr:OFA family MFS transporter [Ruminiclostridium cellulolyticum]ACL76727.1 major facilitator superfamily MFS_1 [Ruminiclostridium cellulolyticum H10]
MKNYKPVYSIIASIAIQLCLGVAYLWSLFQTGIAKSIFDGDNAAASLTFSLLLATLTLGSILGGKLAAKYSIRTVVIIGGVILSLGFFFASFVTASVPWLLWLTYGVMGGVGMGFTYSTTISCAQKWFPHKKGLVTGVIVSALGFGGVVFTPIIEVLIKQFGGQQVGEQKTFMVLSGLFLVICTIGGLMIKNPPDDFENKKSGPSRAAGQESPVLTGSDLSPKQVLATPSYYFVTLAMALACMGGLMMIGFAKPIAVAKGLESTAVVGVLIISICNSFGRLLWGIISDKIGRKLTLIILLAGSGGMSLFVNAASDYWIYVVIAFIGFFYGGFLSNFPALTADLFGARHMATNYGLVLLGFGIGAVVSSYVAGYYKNIAANDISLMFPAFIIAAICAGVGILLVLPLKVKKASVQ